VCRNVLVPFRGIGAPASNAGGIVYPAYIVQIAKTPFNVKIEDLRWTREMIIRFPGKGGASCTAGDKQLIPAVD
jgi:hypothetical protein